MKCKVCGKRFKLLAENRYTASEPKGAFDFSALNVHECFDCPRCGCQNVVNVRMPEVCKPCEKAENMEK